MGTEDGHHQPQAEEVEALPQAEEQLPHLPFEEQQHHPPVDGQQYYPPVEEQHHLPVDEQQHHSPVEEQQHHSPVDEQHHSPVEEQHHSPVEEQQHNPQAEQHFPPEEQHYPAVEQHHPAAEQQAVEQQRADDTGSSGGDSECIICFTAYDGVFKLPKLLRCGHTFCLECLARINVSSEAVTSLNCPICRDVTRLPARRGLPALDNNQDILEQLPRELRPTRSVRFSRKKGLLYVKTKPSPQSPLPKPLQVSSVSLSLDVGRPPPRVRVPPSFARGSWLFYATVAIAVLLTIAVVMVGVYIFFIVPGGVSGSGGPGSSTFPSNSPGLANGTLSPTPRPSITGRTTSS